MSAEISILYSFRRCPCTIRARMAIAASGQRCALRKVLLRDKRPKMLKISSKGIVLIVLLPDGRIIEESLEIMHWVLGKNDPERWLQPLHDHRNHVETIIAETERSFKENLDRYTYANRDEVPDSSHYRKMGTTFLEKLNRLLGRSAYLCGNSSTFADAAVVPSIRQFANYNLEWFNALDLYYLKCWLDSILGSGLFRSAMMKCPTWEIGTGEPTFPT